MLIITTITKKKVGSKLSNPSCHIYHCFKENPSPEANKLYVVLFLGDTQHDVVMTEGFKGSESSQQGGVVLGFCFFPPGVEISK